MKKIYPFLIGTMVAATSFAAVPMQNQRLENATISPMSIQRLQEVKQNIMTKSFDNVKNDGPMRIVTNQDGKEWSLMIAIAGPLQLITVDDQLTTLKDFPFYEAVISTQDASQGGTNFIPMEATWPAKVMFSENEKIWNRDAEGRLIDLNETEVLKEFATMDEALAPVTYEEFAAKFEDNAIMLYMLDGIYYQPQLLPSYQMGENVAMNWNGNKYFPMVGTLDQATGKFDLSNATNFKWTKFDMELSDVDIELIAPYATYTTAANGAIQLGSKAGTASAILSGEATTLGFADVSFDALGEVHIFNEGRITYGTSPQSWSYSTAFDPMNLYFLCFCSEGYGYMATDQNGNQVQNFTENTLPKGNNGTFGVPGYRFEGSDGSLTFFKAGLWAPENSETPYGLWSMTESQYETSADGKQITKYLTPVTPYNLVQALNCSAGTNEGFSGAYQGYSLAAEPKNSWIGIGDKDFGFNFKFAATMTNGYYIKGYSKEDIFYHPTPNKWVSDIQALPAVGNQDFNALEQGNSSSIDSTVSDAPVVSTSYYNFQGQRLASEPQEGLYIVRSVKADGTVVAKKVAK